jgi:hypothetical protein
VLLAAGGDRTREAHLDSSEELKAVEGAYERIFILEYLFIGG